MREFEALSTISDLEKIQRSLSQVALRELRDHRPSGPRERIDALFAGNPSTYSVRSSHGPWRHLEYGRGGRIKEVVSGRGIVFYQANDAVPGIFFLPYGVAGRTDSGIPIFHSIETCEMVSICTTPDYFAPAVDSFHNKPMSPLFNIDKDGAVFASITDTPTPAEQELLYGLLDDVESIVAAEQAEVQSAWDKRQTARLA